MGSAKRAVIELDPELHQALEAKATRTHRSVADLAEEAIRWSLAEDAADLAAFEERANEPVLDFEEALKDLKARGRL
jgi:predicted transcriptional regulator